MKSAAINRIYRTSDNGAEAKSGVSQTDRNTQHDNPSRDYRQLRYLFERLKPKETGGKSSLWDLPPLAFSATLSLIPRCCSAAPLES